MCIRDSLCTRRCPFCDVGHGKPLPPDVNEPANLADSVARLRLRYVVITSVDRDDLRDGGCLLYTSVSSGQELASQAADQRLDPASLTKLMTAYLTFAALRQGTIKIDQAVPVSQKAWKTGGSRMFIQVGTQVKVCLLYTSRCV